MLYLLNNKALFGWKRSFSMDNTMVNQFFFVWFLTGKKKQKDKNENWKGENGKEKDEDQKQEGKCFLRENYFPSFTNQKEIEKPLHLENDFLPTKHSSRNGDEEERG